jgi:hypothetical protein
MLFANLALCRPLNLDRSTKFSIVFAMVFANLRAIRPRNILHASYGNLRVKLCHAKKEVILSTGPENRRKRSV